MPQSSTGHVFMSYSRKDDSVMWRIVEFLRQQGIKVWVDNEKLVPGTPVWEAEIEEAIKAASAIVVVMSPDSKGSEWVRREICLADYCQKRVFPVLVYGDEKTSIPIRIITYQYVDIRTNEKAGLDSLSAALSPYLQAKELEVEIDNKRQHLQRREKELFEAIDAISAATSSTNYPINPSVIKVMTDLVSALREEVDIDSSSSKTDTRPVSPASSDKVEKLTNTLTNLLRQKL
jgi:hypothetical protein